MSTKRTKPASISTTMMDFALANKKLLALGALLCIAQSATSIGLNVQLSGLLDAALGERARLSSSIGMALLMLLLSILTEFCAKDAKLRFANAASRDCTNALLRHLFSRPGNGEDDGKAINLLDQDQDMLYSEGFGTLCELIQYGSSVLFALLALFFLHPLLAALGVAAGGLSLMLNRSFGGPLDKSRGALSDANAAFLHQAEQALQGYDTLKSAGADGPFLQRLAGTRAAAYAAFAANRLLLWVSFGANQFLMTVATLLAVGIVGVLVARGMTTPGSALLVMQMLRLSVGCTRTFVYQWTTLRSVRVVARRVEAELRPAVEEKGAGVLCQGDIELRDVGFSYPGKPVFRGLNAVFPAGGCYAIVGASGCGKTTLMNLLCKQLEPEQGSVLVGGCDLADVTQEALFAQLSLLPQRPLLLNESLRDNIELFGPPMTDDEYGRLLERTGLTAFAGRAADRRLGDMGDAISGGERQRIGLARALRKRPKVLILDEPASGLDPENAARIEALLFSLEGITRFVVTHHDEAAYLSSFDGVLRLDGEKTLMGTL